MLAGTSALRPAGRGLRHAARGQPGRGLPRPTAQARGWTVSRVGGRRGGARRRAAGHPAGRDARPAAVGRRRGGRAEPAGDGTISTGWALTRPPPGDTWPGVLPARATETRVDPWEAHRWETGPRALGRRRPLTGAGRSPSATASGGPGVIPPVRLGGMTETPATGGRTFDQLDALSTEELRERAFALARERRDVGLLLVGAAAPAERGRGRRAGRRAQLGRPDDRRGATPCGGS